MNIVSPLHQENKIILDIEEQIESEHFYCEICCNYAKYPIKYKCNNEKCTTNMCDNCFVEWSKKNKEYKCVYCTKPLEISFTPETIDVIVEPRAPPKKTCLCIKFIYFSASSYFIGYIYTGMCDITFSIVNFILGSITNILIYVLITSCCIPRRTPSIDAI